MKAREHEMMEEWNSVSMIVLISILSYCGVDDLKKIWSVP